MKFELQTFRLKLYMIHHEYPNISPNIGKKRSGHTRHYRSPHRSTELDFQLEMAFEAHLFSLLNLGWTSSTFG